MPKPVLLLIGVIIVLILVFIIAAIVGRGSNNSQRYIELMSRSQEIVRVSEIVRPATKNADTLSLIATTEAALSSEQSNLSNYLATNGTKVSIKNLVLYLDKTSDSKIQAAIQDNNVDSVYVEYLKGQLNTYLGQLQNAHKVAGPKAKFILDNAISSTEVLLKSAQLAGN